MTSLRPTRPSLRWLTATLATLVVALLALPGAAAAAPGDTPSSGSAFPAEDPLNDVPEIPSLNVNDEDGGPVTAADRDFVVKVRLAGLWEIPAGQMATDKGASKRVRAIGESISEQHVKLDELARDTAAKIRLSLPNEPNGDQKTWLGEMKAATGADFDQVFIDRLRAAHGKIFPAIGTIRSGTRNDHVRLLAQQTNQFVLTHLSLLESSSMVNFEDLPKLPDPGAAANASNAGLVTDASVLAAASARNAGGGSSPVIWIVLVTALVAGVFSTIRLVRPR